MSSGRLFLYRVGRHISASHIYNLRDSKTYASVRVHMTHTQARQVSIGERRKPDPRGQPGYLRVDTVHQGHHDGQPGIYHINAVDTVTQWQVVGCVEAISENHLLPVLESMLHQFPFRILGFHCDNGSEFINERVAQMLRPPARYDALPCSSPGAGLTRCVPGKRAR